MKNKLPVSELNGRIAREVEREHYQRTLNDDARSGLLADEEHRIKDPRENGGSTKLKRTL
jgi:hypothetical protein